MRLAQHGPRLAALGVGFNADPSVPWSSLATADR
jgi:hypothetical protein